MAAVTAVAGVTVVIVVAGRDAGTAVTNKKVTAAAGIAVAVVLADASRAAVAADVTIGVGGCLLVAVAFVVANASTTVSSAGHHLILTSYTFGVVSIIPQQSLVTEV